MWIKLFHKNVYILFFFYIFRMFTSYCKIVWMLYVTYNRWMLYVKKKWYVVYKIYFPIIFVSCVQILACDFWRMLHVCWFFKFYGHLSSMFHCIRVRSVYVDMLVFPVLCLHQKSVEKVWVYKYMCWKRVYLYFSTFFIAFLVLREWFLFLIQKMLWNAEIIFKNMILFWPILDKIIFFRSEWYSKHFKWEFRYFVWWKHAKLWKSRNILGFYGKFKNVY